MGGLTFPQDPSPPPSMWRPCRPDASSAKTNAVDPDVPRADSPGPKGGAKKNVSYIYFLNICGRIAWLRLKSWRRKSRNITICDR